MGELLRGIFDEAVGDDPENQRIAGMTSHLAFTGAVMGAVSAVGPRVQGPAGPGM